MKVALVGDSLTMTYYLYAPSNPLLVSHHGKTSSYDYRLFTAIAEKLTRTDVNIASFALGGWTAGKALTDNISYVAGTHGSPINLVAPMWDAVKSWNPDLVIMSWGANDANTYSLAVFDGHLRTMFDDCVELGIDMAVWNGQSVQMGPDYNSAYSVSVRSKGYPFYDKLVEVAQEYGFDTLDTRAAWRAEQLAGNWDLFLHTDGTYLSSLTAGVSDPSKLYDDIHPWIAGQDITSRVLANYLDYGVNDLDIILDEIDTAPYDLDIILDEITGLPLYVNGKQVQEMYADGKRVLKMYVDGKTVFE